ncbi:MAG: FxsA family protein [Sulfuriferula sp.]
MRVLLGMIIVLSFPALEIYTLVQIYHYIGWWILALLLGSMLAGWSLIVGERLAFVARMSMTIQSGGSPLRALIDSGRTMIAGALFIFPGVISDVLAILVLFLPLRLIGGRSRQQTQADNGVIEGEYRREHDDRLER